MIGIRLDSGDLAYLSIEARRMLDEAGFPEAAIVASNDLDEQIIASLKEQGATIGVWGVGTRLVTAYDQPALGGVYKLAAVRDGQGAWQYKVKLSEQAIKVSKPGILQVRRYCQGGEAIGDVIFDEQFPIQGDCTMVDPLDMTRRKTIPAGTARRGPAGAGLPPGAARVRACPAWRSRASGCRSNWGCSTPASSGSSIRTSIPSAWNWACTSGRPSSSSRREGFEP